MRCDSTAQDAHSRHHQSQSGHAVLLLVFCALGTVAFFYNFVALAFIQATSLESASARLS